MKNITIDPTWTLFLDRDGVINVRLVDDYVTSWSAFHFMPDAIATIAAFRTIFKYVFIVTNQQGIGKGLMSERDLQLIHLQMLLMMEQENKTPSPIVNRVYYCPSLRSANDPHRKPEIGMALQAQREFEEVDFQKSIMVGDSISDMEFGRKAGMVTVFFGSEHISEQQEQWIDFRCEDWKAVGTLIQSFLLS